MTSLSLKPWPHLNAFSSLVIIWILAVCPVRFVHGEDAFDSSHGDALLASYFEAQVRQIEESTFADIHSLEDWTSRREEYRRQLLEMLGLDPLPERTPLEPAITGTVEHPEMTVENLYFQSLPGLYVTGNLYLPKEQSEPRPAILYVCGHGPVVMDGISYGNKTHYQHHGEWFARHGYVCLTIDTIQLGEIEGLHHGTHREGMWWWNSRGYTPAGVEAWNCMRALDYLETRPEVDATKIGVTGRSGGGAYSWWIAAVDERIQCAVPVAGITSQRNHVIDGCVAGHCDCMYMVNTYRWDFPMVAALVAPRPLLIANSDKDNIFPLDGVYDVFTKVKFIYDLYGAGDKLGLNITEGPHSDTQPLQVHAFSWMNRHLLGEDLLIEQAATRLFTPPELKVFDQLPDDERVTTVHEFFVPLAAPTTLPSDPPARAIERERLRQQLRNLSFRGWPEASSVMETLPHGLLVEDPTTTGRRLVATEFFTHPGYPLPLYWLIDENAPGQQVSIELHVLGPKKWEHMASALTTALAGGGPAASVRPDEATWQQLAPVVRSEADSGNRVVVLFPPRGVGPTEWTRNERDRIHIRRRFMLLGQTLDGMRTWDVTQAVRVVETLRLAVEGTGGRARLELYGAEDAAVWCLYAALMSEGVDGVVLTDLPESHQPGPDFLNVLRVTDIGQVVDLIQDEVHVELLSSTGE